jgi:hypothetical protein
LQQKFARHVISEIDFENEKARIRRDYALKALEDTEKNGETEKGQIAKLNKERIAADADYHKTLQDNEKRTAELKKELETVKLGLASQVLAAGIELLSKDEAARKKNAGAIKAFQIGQVTIEGISEVQAIWRNAALNKINALPGGVIIANAIAAVQTAIAAGRTIASVAKISATKFAFGGLAKMGIFGGQPHSTGGTKGYFEDGTQIEVEKDEAFAIVNKKNTPLLHALSAVNAFNGNGRPFFADGGIMGINTKPIGFNAISTPPSVISLNLDMVVEKLDKLTQVVASQAKQLKAYIVLSDLEAKQLSVSQDRDNAAY